MTCFDNSTFDRPRLSAMPQAPEFPYDVFLSHSAQDKAVVRPLAERLRQDGPPKAEGRMQKAEVVLQPLAFSFQPFSCAPLNQERRFMPAFQPSSFPCRPHQRLPGAIPLHQLAAGESRAARAESPKENRVNEQNEFKP
jgi:hypothetical protein